MHACTYAHTRLLAPMHAHTTLSFVEITDKKILNDRAAFSIMSIVIRFRLV